MIELSTERVEEILQKETQKTVDLPIILRAVYTRYMNLYERYFTDVDNLNDDKIAELRKYHEETISLVRYYYMDIPQDICHEINEFEDKYTVKLIGKDWKKNVSECFETFKGCNWDDDKDDKSLKDEFAEMNLKAFYESMDSVFREGFGTGSQTADSVMKGISGLFFEEKEK